MKELLIKPEILKKLLFSSLMLLSGAAMAETVSPEQALGKALSFFQQPVHTRGQQAAQSLTLAHTAQADGETYYYVFNNPAGGYVIVGGDDVAHDVLAYSETGAFDAAQLPPAMQWWLSQYEQQIHCAIASGSKPETQIKTATRASERKNIEPLLGGTQWDQALPYAALVNGNVGNPDVSSIAPTGCVATATAQVLRYWKYPAKGMGSHSYKSLGLVQSADFSQTEYKWDLMQDTYKAEYNGTPEEQAVAELMYHVGVALNMFYAPGGPSSAMAEAIPYALHTFFGYDKDMKLYNRAKSDIADDAWEDMVYTELADGRPVIYNGGQHSFVCDGYKDGRFHINWGWNGMNNDYFLLTATETETALTVKESGIGGNNSSRYDEGQIILIGIKPGNGDEEGDIYIPDYLTIADTIPVAPLKFDVKVCNPTSKDIQILPLVQLLDMQQSALGKIDTINIEVSQEPMTIAAKGELIIPVEITQDNFEESAIYTIQFVNKLDDALMSIGIATVEGSLVRIVGEISQLGISTLCLPFDYEVDEASPFKAFAATGIDENYVLILKPVTSLQAGVGYIIQGQPGRFMLKGVPTVVQPVEGQLLIGMLDPDGAPLEVGSYEIMDDVESEALTFNRVESGRSAYLVGYRATLNQAVTDVEYAYVDINNVSAIEQVHYGSKPAVRYNLMGQPTKDKGLVIKDGQVVFEK